VGIEVVTFILNTRDASVNGSRERESGGDSDCWGVSREYMVEAVACF
jgi:hypothetical protein